MASGSTSAHSIQRRPGNSKKETSAASAVPSRKVPAPTPTRRMAVASRASGRKPEKRDSPPRAARRGPCRRRSHREAAASVPPHLVHQVERLLEVRAGAVHVDRVLLEVAELGDLLGRLRALHHRELVVVLGKYLLLARL